MARDSPKKMLDLAGKCSTVSQPAGASLPGTVGYNYHCPRAKQLLSTHRVPKAVVDL